MKCAMGRVVVLAGVFLVALAGVAHAENVDCMTNAQALPGEPGTTHDVVCPANCGDATAWGSGIYSDDSSICTAAIHAGILTRAKGGAVRVTIAGGQESYAASTQNGVVTARWGAWGRSFTVSSVQQSQRIELSCSQNAQTLRGDVGTSFKVTCPPGCGASTVWGSGIYSDDSSICSAAIHAGVAVPEAGGEFTVTIAPGQSSYASSSQNGVTTSSWGSWGRSFTVQGEQ